jgi:peptidoglycan/LPS O-acetylase OafA/YrhL
MYPLRNTVSNFFSAKAIGIVLMLVIIPVVFYTYTAFTKEILAVDIGTFMIAVIVGQTVSFVLYKKTKKSRITEAVAVAVLLLLVVMFIVFTFYQPHLPIFLDSETGRYGV